MYKDAEKEKDKLGLIDNIRNIIVMMRYPQTILLPYITWCFIHGTITEQPNTIEEVWILIFVVSATMAITLYKIIMGLLFNLKDEIVILVTSGIGLLIVVPNQGRLTYEMGVISFTILIAILIYYELGVYDQCQNQTKRLIQYQSNIDEKGIIGTRGLLWRTYKIEYVAILEQYPKGSFVPTSGLLNEAEVEIAESMSKITIHYLKEKSCFILFSRDTKKGLEKEFKAFKRSLNDLFAETTF